MYIFFSVIFSCMHIVFEVKTTLQCNWFKFIKYIQVYIMCIYIKMLIIIRVQVSCVLV